MSDVSMSGVPNNIAPHQLELWAAAEKGDASSVKRCIEQGAIVGMANRMGWNALHRACMGTSPECVQLLLLAAPPPRAELLACTDASGNTPLHLAAGGGNATIVKLLLATNADPALGKAGKLEHDTTPMHTACIALARATSAAQCDAQCAVILALLGGGGLLEATDESGRPAAAVLPPPLMHMLLERVRAAAAGTPAPAPASS